MRIAQISDFHYTCLSWNPLRLFPKRFVGQMNWLLHRNDQFCCQTLEALPKLLASLNVDWVFLGGDFTSSSLDKEFSLAKSFVDQLTLPWIAIPGNHDMYTRSSFKKKRYYQYLKNGNASVFSLDTDGVEAHRIADGWWIIALDTTRPTGLWSAKGLFSQNQEKLLDHFLNSLPKDESVILLNHYPFFQHGLPQHSLEGGERLQALLQRHPNILLYLHGHTHGRIIADLQASRLPVVLDSGCIADKKTGSWNLIDVEKEGCKVTCYEHKTPIQTKAFAWTRML